MTMAAAQPEPAPYPLLSNDPVWALLTNGVMVSIRPLTEHDHAAVVTMHTRMSPESQYLRFFGISERAATNIATSTCRPRDNSHEALGVWLGATLVGVAGIERDPRDPVSAEVAVAVADELHGHGVATLLLEHLVSRARTMGIRRFTAEVLTANAAMLRVFADAGLEVVETSERGVVLVEAGLDSGESYLEAVGAREQRSQAASLRRVVAPESVVVIGASERPGNLGGAVVANLLAAGYAGRLAVVHPRAKTVAGVPSWSRLLEVPFIPDLAVIVVPAAALLGVIRTCGERGVRAALVLTSGVDAETGRAMRDTCRHFGMRLVGPNCLGIANPSIGLDLTFAARRAGPGRAGVAVQSGGVGIALTEHLDRLAIGVSTFVSLGDKYDVSATDLLQLWYDDPATELALLYVESFGNPRKFARVARRIAARVPVLAVDGGRSVPAQRAAASHTAAAATPTAARQALFIDAGIIAVPDLGDLVGAAALLAHQPLPRGFRVGVISNAGGAGILAADACTDAGLELPELTAVTRERLAAILPAAASTANPVDAGAATGRHALAAAAVALAADPNVDAVVVLPVPTGLDDMAGLVWPGVEPELPFVAVRLEGAERVRVESQDGGRDVPVYASPRDAAVALARAATYSQWRQHRGDATDDATVPDLDLSGARGIVRRFLAEQPAGGWLGPAAAADFLATTGVGPVPVREVVDADGAVAAATELGFPVALKAYGPDLLHKQYANGIVLGLADAEQVKAAYDELATRHGAAMTAAAVQPMVSGDLELLIGVNSDSVFGPVVAFGLGGTEADALADRVVRLAPLSEAGADAMLGSIRAAKVLDRAVGGGPVDRAALRDLLYRVSLLAHAVPELADMDLNPVLARADGLAAIDVKVRLSPRLPYDPFLRRLR